MILNAQSTKPFISGRNTNHHVTIKSVTHSSQTHHRTQHHSPNHKGKSDSQFTKHTQQNTPPLTVYKTHTTEHTTSHQITRGSLNHSSKTTQLNTAPFLKLHVKGLLHSSKHRAENNTIYQITISNSLFVPILAILRLKRIDEEGESMCVGGGGGRGLGRGRG